MKLYGGFVQKLQARTTAGGFLMSVAFDADGQS